MRSIEGNIKKYLVVRLLMTPVVVSYCFASANIPAIPGHHNEWDYGKHIDTLQTPTYSGVEVGDNGCRGDDK